MSSFEVRNLTESKSQPTINNWENGKSCPSIEQLKALAKVLGLSISYLVADTQKWQVMLEKYA